MTKDFAVFLSNNINEELAGQWQESMIRKVETWNQERIWRLYIEAADLLPGEQIDKTADQIKACCSFLEQVEICQIPQDYKEKISSIISSGIKGHDNSTFPRMEKWDEVEFEVASGRIDFTTRNPLIYQEILETDICTQTADWFWQQYRLRILVRILLIQEETKQAVDYVYIPDRPLQVVAEPPADKRNRKSKKGNIDKAAIVKIDEVQEGMVNIAIAGEVWDKNVHRINDRLFVVTYYVYDHTSSLMVKSFYNQLEEDKIQIGDWYKFCGDVRYDKYSSEVTMNMAASQKIKKELRQDNSARKRVELHAHTKMSSMDGQIGRAHV